MATGILDLGDYTLEDDSNGDLIIKDPNGTIVMRWDNSNGRWTLENNSLFGVAGLNGGITTSEITNFEGTNLSVSSNTLNSEAADDPHDNAAHSEVFLPRKLVSSNTTSSGSAIYLVDTSGGAKTFTLASSDATNEESIGVVNISGDNTVTVETESTETIDPNGDSSKTLSTGGYLVWFNGDGSNWNSSLDIDVESVSTNSATINNGDGVGIPTTSTSTDATLGGGWVTEDADRPTQIFIVPRPETDGSSNGVINIDIDFDGGTTADISLKSIADSGLGSGVRVTDSFVYTLPSGAQHQFRNKSDPNNSNIIDSSIKQIL